VAPMHACVLYPFNNGAMVNVAPMMVNATSGTHVSGTHGTHGVAPISDTWNPSEDTEDNESVDHL